MGRVGRVLNLAAALVSALALAPASGAAFPGPAAQAQGAMSPSDRTGCRAFVDPITGEGACSFTHNGGDLSLEGLGARQAVGVQARLEWRQLCLGRSPYCTPPVPIVYPQATINPPLVTVVVRQPSGEALLSCTGVLRCATEGATPASTDGAVLTCEMAVSEGTGPYVGVFGCASQSNSVG